MTDLPRVVELADGTRLTLRLSAREDFEFALGFYRRQPEKDISYLRRDVRRRSVLAERYEEIESGNMMAVMAIADGMVAGEGSIFLADRGWYRNTGEIRMVIDVNYRGKGLGNVIYAELEAIAKEKGAQKLEIQFMSGQPGVAEVFGKLDYEKEGSLKNMVVDIHGKEHNLILMGKQL
jgi:L-amino acid N-acyltransferase YncA